MKRLLVGLLLIGIAGCGDGRPGPALEKLGASINRNEQGDIVKVQLDGPPLGDAQITDAGMVHLEGMTNLRKLDVSFCSKVTDTGLAYVQGLTSLQDLRLNRIGVTDAGMVHLKGLTNLQNLEVWDTQITDAGLVHCKGMTKLQSLNLRNTQITDAGLANLNELSKLQTLDIRGCIQITDKGVAELEKSCTIIR